MSDLPDKIQVWRSEDGLDHMGTWATTRYPAEAVTYVRKVDAQAAVALMVERAAGVLSRHSGAPMVPSDAWSDEEQEGYINGQMDAAGSWKSAILAINSDAAAALARAVAVGRAVKPLVWDDQGHGENGGSYSWPLGLHYYVEGRGDDWFAGCMIGESDVWTLAGLQSRDAAKAAAQDDYAARIRVALVEGGGK